MSNEKILVLDGAGACRCAGEAVDEVVMRCIGQVGADAYNARRVAMAALTDRSTTSTRG